MVGCGGDAAGRGACARGARGQRRLLHGFSDAGSRPARPHLARAQAAAQHTTASDSHRGRLNTFLGRKRPRRSRHAMAPLPSPPSFLTPSRTRPSRPQGTLPSFRRLHVIGVGPQDDDALQHRRRRQPLIGPQLGALPGGHQDGRGVRLEAGAGGGAGGGFCGGGGGGGFRRVSRRGSQEREQGSVGRRGEEETVEEEGRASWRRRRAAARAGQGWGTRR